MMKNIVPEAHFIFYVPIAKSLVKPGDSTKGFYVEGYALTSDPDRQGDIVLLDALQKGIIDLDENISVFYNHDTESKPIGKIVDKKVIRTSDTEGKLWVRIFISELEKEIIKKVKEGVINKLSVQGIIPKKAIEEIYDNDGKTINRRIHDMEIWEVSIVGLPANVKAETIGYEIKKSLSLKNEKIKGENMPEEIKKDEKIEKKEDKKIEVKQEEKKETSKKKETKIVINKDNEEEYKKTALENTTRLTISDEDIDACVGKLSDYELGDGVTLVLKAEVAEMVASEYKYTQEDGTEETRQYKYLGLKVTNIFKQETVVEKKAEIAEEKKIKKIEESAAEKPETKDVKVEKKLEIAVDSKAIEGVTTAIEELKKKLEDGKVDVEKIKKDVEDSLIKNLRVVRTRKGLILKINEEVDQKLEPKEENEEINLDVLDNEEAFKKLAPEKRKELISKAIGNIFKTKK